jgi:uncharacterized membrane protein (DUF4010 family)
MAVNGLEAVESLGLSLAIGLLIGVERGWRLRDEKAGTRIAGLRTFGLLGLIGGLAGLVPIMIGAGILLAGAAIISIGYLRQSSDPDNLSATNMIVALLTILLGYLATTGFRVPALAAAATATVLLSMREQLHRALKGMSPVEIQSVGRFALIALVILPLLPDRRFGPLDAWNPRQIWMVVVLVSGLSFAGYLATRRLGPKTGLLMTALCGAVVSSTAVTVAFAHRLKSDPENEGALTAGIALASVVMFVRVMLLTALLVPAALPSLSWAIAPATLVALVLAALALRRMVDRPAAGEIKLGNPLELVPAFGFAAMVAALAVASRWAELRFGDAGIAILLSLTGLADVDAAVITLAGLPAGTLDGRMAGLVLASPVLLNTLFKAALTLGIAPGRTGWRAALPLLASVFAAGVALAALI